MLLVHKLLVSTKQVKRGRAFFDCVIESDPIYHGILFPFSAAYGKTDCLKVLLQNAEENDAVDCIDEMNRFVLITSFDGIKKNQHDNKLFSLPVITSKDYDGVKWILRARIDFRLLNLQDPINAGCSEWPC